MKLQSANLSNSETQVQLELIPPPEEDPPIPIDRYWIKYSLNDTPLPTDPPSALLTTSPVTITLPAAPVSGDTHNVEYCIANSSDASQPRSYHCDTLTAIRSAGAITSVIEEPQFVNFPADIEFDLALEDDSAFISVSYEFSVGTSPVFSFRVLDENVVSAVFEPVFAVATSVPGTSSSNYRITPTGVGETEIVFTLIDIANGFEVESRLAVEVVNTTNSAELTIDSINQLSPLRVAVGDVESLEVYASGGTEPLTYSAETVSESVAIRQSSADEGFFDIEGLTADEDVEITLTVTDSRDMEAMMTLDVEVLDDLNPVAEDDTIQLASLTESQLLTVTNNDSDPLGFDFSVVLASSTSDEGGALVRDGNQINYTPPSNLTRDDSFEYYLINDNELESNGRATVTLQLPDTGPSAPPGVTYYTDNCSDCHGTGGTTTSDSGPPQLDDEDEWQDRINNAGSLEALVERVVQGRIPGMITYPQSSDLVSAVSYLTGGVEPQTGGGEPPVAMSDEYTITASNGSQLLPVLENDDPPSGLTIDLESFSSQLGATLNVESNQVRYQAPAGFSSTDSFNYRAVNSSGVQSGFVAVTVNPSDRDSDGIFDTIDNCPNTPSTNQSDSDSDGDGDICDPTPNGGSPSTELSGEALARAEALVTRLCAGCHINPANALAPQRGDRAQWDRRLAEADMGLEGLVNTAIVGIPGVMQAFGEDNSPAALTEAVLYLGGFATDANGEVVPGSGPGTEQPASPGTDGDGDGYVASLDDDDTNARQLPGRVPVTGPAVYFISDSEMTLGDMALGLLAPPESQSGGLLIDNSAFLQAAASTYPTVTHSVEANLSSVLGNIDLTLNLAGGTDGQVLVQLISTLPIGSVLRTYDTQNGSWSEFLEDSGVGEVASAQSIDGICPLASSPNYIPGLGAGLRCFRVRASDGGLNDADRQENGQISLIMNLASTSNDGPGPDPTQPVASGGGSSGGGKVGAGFLILLALSLLTLLLARSRRCRV